MCMIVDACVASHLKNKTFDGLPILRWLFSSQKKSKLIIGGQLTNELYKAGIGDLLSILKQAARLHEVEESALASEEAVLKKNPEIRSNDPHVLAISRIAQARLVFTTDKDLRKDLKNKKVVPQKVSIYTNGSHAHLIRNCQ
jgi:hypothetical protein